ncbi:hypothetical protein M2351_004333 [Azospirillum canadense]|nr:hypothetical protein [Azospirillum canadense]
MRGSFLTALFLLTAPAAFAAGPNQTPSMSETPTTTSLLSGPRLTLPPPAGLGGIPRFAANPLFVPLPVCNRFKVCSIPSSSPTTITTPPPHPRPTSVTVPTPPVPSVGPTIPNPPKPPGLYDHTGDAQRDALRSLIILEDMADEATPRFIDQQRRRGR